MQKTNQKEFRIEKVIKRKDDKLYVESKGYDNSFNSRIDKKDLVQYCIKMSQYFPKPYEAFGGDINVKVDLSNYATKADIKNISHVDTSSFALKTNLANLKTEEDKLDIDKLKPLPDDVSKLRNVVTNEVVKKTDYNAKITDLENKFLDISNLATKTALTNLSNTVPDISTLIKKSDCDTKIREIENKYVSNTGFDSKLTQANVITKRCKNY